jgi:hypothetical protein
MSAAIERLVSQYEDPYMRGRMNDVKSLGMTMGFGESERNP